MWQPFLVMFLFEMVVAGFSVPGGYPISHLVSNGALGRVYVSAGANVYSLSQDLQELDHLTLVDESNIVSGMAVSYHGQWLVICAQDSTCRVVNGSAVNDEPNTTQAGAIARGMAGVAVFTDTGNTFYTGGAGTDEEGLGNRHVFGQFGFAGNNLCRLFDEVSVTSGFTRVMYGGFYNSPYAYYLAVDTELLVGQTHIRIVRVCNENASVDESVPFAAVYEVELDCGSVFVSVLAGVSLLNGKTLMLGVTSTTSGAVCLYNLSSIDAVMNSFYQACLVGDLAFTNNMDAWSGYSETCDVYSAPNSMCDFSSSSPGPRVISPSPAYTSGIVAKLDTEVSGIDPAVLSGLTQSMAVVVDEQTILYLGYSETNHHYLVKYHLNGTMAMMVDTTPLLSAVLAFSWSQGSGFVYVATEAAEVVRVPLENCSSYLTCSECATSSDPLCGWCSVEAKCSRVVGCQNSDVIGRYIKNGQGRNCFDLVTVEPVEFITDSVTNGVLEVLLSFSPGGLPQTLPGEKYFCQFSGSEMNFPFVTPLVGGVCDVEALANSMTSIKMVTMITIYSSLTEVNFVTVSPDYTFISCFLADRCSVCVDSNGICGWCTLDFLCTSNDSLCSSGDSTRKILSTGQTYKDVCPLLLPSNESSDGSYSQAVNVSKNLTVYGRNLPDVGYQCFISYITAPFHGLRKSEEAVQCIVSVDDVNFIDSSSSSVGSELRGFELRQLSTTSQSSYLVESFNQLATSVTLYECSTLANESDCSLCLAQNTWTGFNCGWCPSSTSSPSRCQVDVACSESGIVTQSGGCPLPVISMVHPNRGPPQGGTTIIIKGSNLGVSITDITHITVGKLTCQVTAYRSGQEITCLIESSNSTTQMNTHVLVTISRDAGPSQTAMAQFRFLNPLVESVFPSFGPASGGTEVLITGQNLDIGNVDQTSVQFLVFVSSSKKREAEPVIAGICAITMIDSTFIECVSGALADWLKAEMSTFVQVTIDKVAFAPNGLSFVYKQDPVFVSLSPQTTIPSGGIALILSGKNLESAQSPLMEITDSRFNQSRPVVCEAWPTMLRCNAPRLSPNPSNSDYRKEINYTVTMDNAPGPDITEHLLSLILKPDPTFIEIVESDRTHMINDNTSSIRIRGENIDSVEDREIAVTVGQDFEACTMPVISNDSIVCIPPLRKEPVTESVYVQVGTLSPVNVGELVYYSPSSSLPSAIIGTVVGVVVANVLIVVTIFIVVALCFRFKIKNTPKPMEIMPSTKQTILPLQENIGYQSTTAALASHNNPAYNTRGEIHTYEYIPVGGMAVTGIEQHPPELPPDRKIEVQDANNELKLLIDGSKEDYVNEDLGPPPKESLVNDDMSSPQKIKEDTVLNNKVRTGDVEAP